ncbi:MAG: DUF2752 domain-containing protein [Crocinitomicaceae bacterium]|nr:DUF2752 domain-containing protein [Crocinitomicaceae bacterium]
MIALPVWLLLSPANYFDAGESICPSKVFFGKECPGCGMTRATQHMIHFDFNEAWNFNKLSFFILPVLGFLYARIFYKFLKRVT